MYLRQSTASQTRTIGPFVDDTDFKTLKNALTIANTDILLKKNGGASAAKNSGGATADGSGGMYHLTFDATDTATVGELFGSVKVANALVVPFRFIVVEEVIYDALFVAGASALPSATAGAAGGLLIAGSNAATTFATLTSTGAMSVNGNTLTFSVANQLDVNMLSQASATVYTKDFTLSAYSSNTITLPSTYADSSSLPDDDRYTDCIISIVAGTGKGTFLRTTTAAAGARVYNIDAPIVAPDNTSQCIVTQCLRLAPITTNWFTADGLATSAVTEIVSAIDSEAIADAVVAAIAAGGATITVVSPTVDSDNNFTIIKGDDYYSAESRNVTWTSSDWPSLSGATIYLKAMVGVFSYETTPCTASGSGSQTVSCNVPTSFTSNLLAGEYLYDLEAVLSNGHVVTLVQGTMTILAQVE